MKKLVGTIAIAICCAVAEPQIVKAADAPAPVIVDNSGKFTVDRPGTFMCRRARLS